MYGRYPVNIPPAVIRTENRYIVYVVLAFYTIAVAGVGYLVGEQAFDPVEQARFEERHWQAQATAWKFKVDEWKQNYNTQSNVASGGPIPCPICSTCPVPTICIADPGITCAADPCNRGQSSLPSAIPPSEKTVASTVDSSFSPLPPLSTMVGDRGSGVVPEVLPTKKSKKSKKNSEKEQKSRFPSLLDGASHAIDYLAGFNTGEKEESQVSYVENDQVVAAGEEGADDDLACPACYICPATEASQPAPLVDINHVECDKEAMLQKIDSAEKDFRGLEAAHRNVEANSKFATKISRAHDTYQEMQRCLELAMPAVFEAYQETVKARFGG